ncbi:MAG TPA: hypothetical protein VD887_13620 [Allosphingosinicella sp.]|nr:hypothetical protein [Allosphingosinicella sp.]HYG31239.1 hypothetical protein [Allosphingosinicella sp.]
MNRAFRAKATVGIGVAGSLASVAALFVSGGGAPAPAPSQAQASPQAGAAQAPAPAAAAPVAPPRQEPSLSWLAGSWVPAGESCFTDAGWMLSPDLSFSGDFLNGLWELAGDRLTIDWHSLDEDAPEASRHGIWRFRVARASEDEMILTKDGETTRMRRCRRG